MQQAISIFLKHLQQQGFSVVLLVAAIWWMNLQNQHLNEKVDQCNANTLEIYKEENAELKRIIGENTRAYQDFSYLIEKLIEDK